MGDRLVGYFRVEIGGVIYENGSPPETPGQPVSLEIEHRDDESSRLTLTVFDNVTLGSVPYPEFNRIPNPRKFESVPVLAWAEWEDEQIVKMFEGNLTIKTMDEEIPSHTKFVALHDSYKLRKKAKSDVPRNISVRQMLIRKAAEHGCILKFDASTNDEPALNEPMEVFHQPGEANWDLMTRYIKSLGFVTINKERNVLIVTRDKLSGTIIGISYGDENIKRLSLREENKKASHHPKRRGHHHEGIAGKHAIYPPVVAVPGDGGKGVHWREQPLAKHVDSHRKLNLAKASVLGKGKRLKIEGDELDVQERFRPIMVNHEVYVVNGYGPDIDDAYQTAMVRHKMGSEWTTESTCWRP